MKLNEADFKVWGASNSYLYLDWMNKYCEEFEVNTPDRLLCFIPNLLHESNNFRSVREILPKNNPAYVAKLGKFIGRGLIQLSWESNYKAFTDFCKKTYPDFKEDFVKNPVLVESPRYAVLSAFWFWKANNLKAWADGGHFREVCSIINTGKPNSQNVNGWQDRQAKRAIVEDWIVKIVVDAARKYQ
jgi:putative chitinase